MSKLENNNLNFDRVDFKQETNSESSEELKVKFDGNDSIAFDSGGLIYNSLGYNSATNYSTAIQNNADLVTGLGQSVGSSRVGGMYRLNVDTSDTDPGAGFFQLNNSNPDLVTELYLSNTIKGTTINLRNFYFSLFGFNLKIWIQRKFEDGNFYLWSSNGTIDLSQPNYVKFKNMSVSLAQGSFINGKDHLVLIQKDIGQTLSGKKIPLMPSNNSGSYILKYEQSSDSFSWISI